MAIHHAAPGEVVGLQPLRAALVETNTAAIVKSDRFEAIRLIVKAGTIIPEHHVAGYVTIQCLEGRVRLAPLDIELAAGDWVYLERNAPHTVEGLEDSSLLLTILFDNG